MLHKGPRRTSLGHDVVKDLPLIINQKTVPEENIQYNVRKTEYQSCFGKGVNGCDITVRNSLVQLEEHLKTTSIRTNKVVKDMLLFVYYKSASVEDFQYNVWER
jgi:hypothetical protein